VPRRDPQAVADVMRGVLQDPASLKAMGRAARRKSVEEFSVEAFSRQTEQVYLSLARVADTPKLQPRMS
jgi:L-malate glycosyltransferase